MQGHWLGRWLEASLTPAFTAMLMQGDPNTAGVPPGTIETSGGANVLGPGLVEVEAVATLPLVEQPATRVVPFWVAAVRWAKGRITCSTRRELHISRGPL